MLYEKRILDKYRESKNKLCTCLIRGFVMILYLVLFEQQVMFFMERNIKITSLIREKIEN
jgi:hypothetical protein